MCVLAATGMRRSELAGVERDTLDLNQGTVTIENTRIVVKGHATVSGGKTESSRRTISLGPFTVAALHRFVEMIEGERDAFGTSYPDHGMLMCFEDADVRGASRANAAATGKLASTRPRSRHGIADRG